MPKRAKTPELFDDAKYLTVVGPYPPHPNMELAQHRMEFARWIGACTGPEFLRAFYHKPTSPGSVIMEIDESFPDFKRLLGEHKWSEFLVDPGDQGRYVSKVFYCTYNTDRDVQKNGWKRVDVEDKWFKSRAASKFVSPYPATYYCEVPRERNVIHNPLCRPLPRSTFPPPPPEPSPVVGTPEWQEWKQRQNTQNTPRVVTARTRPGAPPMTAAASTGSAAGTPPTASRTSSSSSARSDGAPQPIPRNAWSNVNTPLSPPGLPVGIMRNSSSSGSSQRSTAGGSAWGEPPSQRSASPPETLSSPSSASSDDVQPVTPSGGGDPRQNALVAEERLERALAESSVDDYELEDDVYYSVNGGSVAGDAPPVEFDIRLMPRANAVFVAKEGGTSSAPNATDDDDFDDDEDETANNPELCPEHNAVCRKGICLFYAARKRELNREKRRQELEKERAERQARREKNAKKKARKLLAEDPEDIASSGSSRTASPARPAGPTRQRPPHLRPSAPVAPARAPPAHLKAGAPPPSPGSARPMPPHLQRGPSSGGPTSPPVDGRPSPAPSRTKSDGVHSEGSGWGNISEGPWAAAAPASKKNSRGTATPALSAPAPKPAWSGWGKAPSVSASSVQRNNESWSAPATSVAGDDHDQNNAPPPKGKGKNKASPAAPRAEARWGKAPSISASSVQRNHDSWSVPARSVSGDTPPKAKGSAAQSPQHAWGNWGKAPSVSASSVARNHGSWSVGTRSVAGDGDDAPPASDDGQWGRPPSVAGPSRPGRTWADEMDEEDEANARGGAAAADDDDVRSVATSTESGWGSISNGPW